jgi:photosystem II stability/assembly factor-like uncharacterized protein
MIRRVAARQPLCKVFIFNIVTLWVCTAAAQPALDFVWGHPAPQGNTIYGFAFADADHGWAVCGGGGVLATTDGGVSWTRRAAVPGRPHLYDVALLADGTLVAAGTGAGLFVGAAGGVAWSTPAHPATGKLLDVALRPDGAVSVVGDAGAVLLSTDGGLTWVNRGIPTTENLRYHCWTSDQVCVVVTSAGAWRTVDAGLSWTPVITGQFFGLNEVFFTDPLTGYANEDFDTWTTTDGGATWTQHSNFTAPLYRHRTEPLTATHWLAVAAGEGGELWETFDAGQTWAQRLNRNVNGFQSLYRAPGGRVFFGSDAGDLLRTDDGGQTISNAAANQGDAAPGVPMNFLMRRPDGVVFAATQPSVASDPQLWLRSDDGGLHWARLADAPAFRWATDGAFFDDQTGVVGSYADIARTSDGGATWQESALPTGQRVWRFALPAADRFFVTTYTTGGGGGLYVSVDGGAVWTPVTGGLPASFLGAALAFLDSQNGWLSCRTGTTPRLFRTTDGGAHWTEVAMTGLGDTVDSFHWFDAQTGLACGRTVNCTGIFRTIDGGAHWTQVDATRTNRFSFRDPLHGVACMSSSTPLRHTADGGLTWQVVPSPFDGGQPRLGDGAVTVALALDDGWLLGGQNNRLVVGRDAQPAATPPPADPAGIPAARLVGVEPNPFNPRTVIALRAERAGAVRLAVYDLRGRCVRHLLATPMQAGEIRRVAWDGRDDAGRAMPAGLYLARLESAGGVDGRKLLLVK